MTPALLGTLTLFFSTVCLLLQLLLQFQTLSNIKERSNSEEEEDFDHFISCWINFRLLNLGAQGQVWSLIFERCKMTYQASSRQKCRHHANDFSVGLNYRHFKGQNLYVATERSKKVRPHLSNFIELSFEQLKAEIFPYNQTNPKFWTEYWTFFALFTLSASRFSEKTILGMCNYLTHSFLSQNDCLIKLN